MSPTFSILLVCRVEGYGSGRAIVGWGARYTQTFSLKRDTVFEETFVGLLILSKGDVIGHTFCNVGLLAAGDNCCAGTVCNFLGVLLGLRSAYRPSNITITFSIRRPAFHRGRCTSCGTKHGPVPRRLQTRVPILGRLLATLNCAAIRYPN